MVKVGSLVRSPRYNATCGLMVVLRVQESHVYGQRNPVVLCKCIADGTEVMLYANTLEVAPTEETDDGVCG